LNCVVTAGNAPDQRIFLVIIAPRGLLETSARWLEAKGMPYDQASTYLKQLFAGLSKATGASPAQSFDAMRWDFSTKGGLNEQVFSRSLKRKVERRL
jgi:pyrroline-5-carboxylate reductase